MATDLQPSRITPVKPAAVKYESYVEEHLSLARRRIRLLDLAAGGPGFLALTFAYGLVLALDDRKMEFSSLTRHQLFAGYGLGAPVYLCFVVLAPLFRRRSPHYAPPVTAGTLPHA